MINRGRCDSKKSSVRALQKQASRVHIGRKGGAYEHLKWQMGYPFAVSQPELMSWIRCVWLGRIRKCVVSVCLQEQGWETLPYDLVEFTIIRTVAAIISPQNSKCMWSVPFEKVLTNRLHHEPISHMVLLPA